MAHLRLVAAVFENGCGMKRGLPLIQRPLERHGLYSVVLLEMILVHLGEPQNRPRLYFMAARKDTAVGNNEDLQRVATFVWEQLRNPKQRACDSQLLPDDHPECQGSSEMHSRFATYVTVPPAGRNDARRSC